MNKINFIGVADDSSPEQSPPNGDGIVINSETVGQYKRDTISIDESPKLAKRTSEKQDEEGKTPQRKFNEHEIIKRRTDSIKESEIAKWEAWQSQIHYCADTTKRFSSIRDIMKKRL
jgi:hypothetical protein